MHPANPPESAAAAMVRYMRTTGRPSPELADLARIVFAADRGANMPPGGPTDDDCAADEEPERIALPMIRPDFGGALAAQLTDNELSLSYTGPAPFGSDLDELLGAVALHLRAARRLRIVEGLRLVAAFTDEDGDDDEGGDTGSGE